MDVKNIAWWRMCSSQAKRTRPITLEIGGFSDKWQDYTVLNQMPSTERVSRIIGLLCMKWLCLLDLCEDTNYYRNVLDWMYSIQSTEEIQHRYNIATIFLLVNDHLDFIQLSQHVSQPQAAGHLAHPLHSLWKLAICEPPKFTSWCLKQSAG